MKKTRTSVDKLIEVLADGEWHSSEELIKKVSHRFGSTIHIARKRGYQVETRQISTTKFLYRLITQSDE